MEMCVFETRRQLDQADRQLLNLLQEAFPLVPAPYAALGKALGVGEAEILRRVRRLKDIRVLRQVSAIFDTRALGYASCLVAARVDPDRVDEAAQAVSRHPGVTHNYRRSHAFNLWFTLAVAPDSRLGLERTSEILGKQAGAEAIRLFPTLRLFKIGVRLEMADESDSMAREEKRQSTPQASRNGRLTEKDLLTIRLLQDDLPVVPRPFEARAREAGISVEDLLFHADAMQARGLMRRFAAVLHHRQAGYRANGMGVWVVSADRVEAVGQRMTSFRAVSHCYERPTYPDWPYSLFTMVHGRSQEDCERILEEIERETGISERAVLYSTKEYKKVRLRYFTPEQEVWEAAHLSAMSNESKAMSNEE